MFSAKDARANVMAYREALEKEWSEKANTWVEEILHKVETLSAQGVVTCTISGSGMEKEVRERAFTTLGLLDYTVVAEGNGSYRITW